MIGLEGSGFTICLGVILLLTGIVMYYCKSKITACENRMNTMLNLISDLHSEVSALKQGSYVAHPVAHPVAATAMPESDYATTTEFVAESESEEDDDSDEEEREEEITLEKAVNPFETHPYKELIPSNSTVGADVINESSESEGDTDEETPKQEVKVVDLGQIEELEIDDLDEEEEEVEETSEEEGQIDYAKMQVTALKKLAAERQLAPNVHKLRKQELVNLLQSH
jgi:hypothetical protein